MIYPLALLMICLAGWSITGLMRGTANGVERFGLAVLFGYGLITLLMLSLHLTGLPIAAYVYLPVLALFSIDGLRRLFMVRRSGGRGPLDLGSNRELRLREVFRGSHPIVAFAGGIVLVALLLIIVWRCLYLPNAVYDSLAGFDLLGKVIAAEQKFRVSLFDYSGIARRGTYPPFTALTLAWGYQCGLTSSLAMLIAPLLGFLVWSFGFARRYLGGTSALGLLVLAMVTPDFYAWCHQPATQFPMMAFCAPLLLYIFAALRERRKRELLPAAVAALFLAWCRPDALVLVAGSSVALLLFARRSRLGTRAVLFPIPAIVLFVLWHIYSTQSLGQAATARMVLEPYWDAPRIQLIASEGLRLLFALDTIGFATYFFCAALASYALGRDHGGLAVPIALLVSLALYWLLFYQTDPVGQDPLPILMRSSYRRGLTAYVLPFWFVWLVSQAGVWSRKFLGGLFAGRDSGETATEGS